MTLLNIETSDILINVLVPLVMFVIMAIIGLDLSIRDFRRVAVYPRPLILGTLVQLTMLPLLAALIIGAMPLTGAEIGALIIIAACPGGGLSNIMTAKAGGNVALSVSYTALTSVLALATIPLVTSIGFALFLERTAEISVPLVPMIAQLVVLIFIPVCLGMWLREQYPVLIRRHYRNINRGGNVLIFIIIALSFTVSHDVTARAVVQAVPIAVGFSIGSLLLGLLAARLIGMDYRGRVALLIEFCVRNVAVATLIIVVILKNFEMVALLAACAVVQAVLILLVTIGVRLLGGVHGDDSAEVQTYRPQKERL